jgi:hypothetical protein
MEVTGSHGNFIGKQTWQISLGNSWDVLEDFNGNQTWLAGKYPVL